MERIRSVAAVMLSEKMGAAAAVQQDGEAQRDIMSLLVRARLADAHGAQKTVAGPAYAMSDAAMMYQVVCVWYQWRAREVAVAQRRCRSHSYCCAIVDVPRCRPRDNGVRSCMGAYPLYRLPRA